MPILPQIALGAYLLFLVAAGWRLFGIGWSLARKRIVAGLLVLPAPLLFLIPAFMRRGQPFADMLLNFGLALLVCGALCLGSGMLAAWLRARPR